MNDYGVLFAGVICAGAGGELFVRGSVGAAHSMRVSPGIIGATVVAFATSSPELSVAVSSALAGKPQIALGDALGSNVVNVALILGLALLISGIKSSRKSIRRDFPVALLTPVVMGLLMLDGMLSRLDGLLLLGLFGVWLVATIMEVIKQRSAGGEVIGESRGYLAGIQCIVGLILLMAAGRWIVTGARGIALAYGIDEFIIGATIVAIGTSLPELATALIAKFRGHDDVGLGTILGSNIFNGLLIVAVAAVIFPIRVDLQEVATALVVGLVAVACSFPTRLGFIERRRGVLLVGLYAVYLVSLLQR